MLFRPSPSGSALAAACGQLVQPKYCNCQHVNGSPAVTFALPFIVAVQPLVTLDAMIVYVPTAVWFVNEIALPVPRHRRAGGIAVQFQLVIRSRFRPIQADCHAAANGAVEPPPVTLNVAGFALTVSVAPPEIAGGLHVPLTTQSKLAPESPMPTPVSVNVFVAEPLMVPPSLMLTPFFCH